MENLNDNHNDQPEQPKQSIDPKQLLTFLRGHQDIIAGTFGGIYAAIIGALLWAVITVATEYQIGFMAIGVGLLVGFAVRYFGKGVDKIYGYIGAALSLLGCLFGNILSVIGFVARAESIDYFQLLAQIDLKLLIQLVTETFDGMDLLFYGIAVYEGYRFSLKKVEPEDIALFKKVSAAGEYQERPKMKMRIIMAVGLMVIVLVMSFLVKSPSGFVSYTYPSGAKLSEGELINGKLDGKWTFWYENGEIQSIRYYNRGIEDSLWTWYDEAGNILRKGSYRNGLIHGRWETYHPNSQISEEGDYINNRKDGKWIFWYANGTKHSECYFKRDQVDSLWISWHENGNKSEEGRFKDNNKVGKWISWYKNGIKKDIKEYKDQKVLILSSWGMKGESQIVNGNGIYTEYFDDGKKQISGKVMNGEQVGRWTSWYENGNLKEEIIYQNEKYQIENFYFTDGNQLIKDGNGKYILYYDNGNKMVEGEIKNGFRDGEWYFYFENGVQQVLTTYSQNKQNGFSRGWYESGNPYFEGQLANDEPDGEWTWWHDNGNIQCQATFQANKKEGKQIFWSESGRLIKEEFYKDGTLISEKIL